MNERGLTTVWWVVGDSVARQDVSEPDAILCDGLFGPGATAYYVSDADRPWTRATDGRAVHPAPHEVPVEAREACALWLPRWAGRHCAKEWLRGKEASAALGLALWKPDGVGVPTYADVVYLRDCTWRLLGREPSETERRAFGEALLTRIFELASDDGGAGRVTHDFDPGACPDFRPACGATGDGALFSDKSSETTCGACRAARTTSPAHVAPSGGEVVA